ncbi:hypothetical protein QVD17_37982 [Tagetes erecta]|uniref:Uncharacterized protein n=1 Tax=Tagetes erecta TaxID=13708 RepID=A0AAD8JWZ1_TARER|nr:hypothetical protein QVD17_37982 [Tagetes erecta]
MFRSSSPLLRKSEPPVQVQDIIITAWTIRHPTRNRNDPIARADWSEKCDVAEEFEKKDKKISNLSETIAKQDETIAQLHSEMEKLTSEKEIEKDVKSSYVEMPIDDL